MFWVHFVPIGAMMTIERPNIFSYNDHRKYLKDMVEFQKSKDRKFSLIYYSKQIDRSDSYLKLVVNKKRRLNLDTAVILAKKLRCDISEKSYFLTLVLRDDCASSALKNYFEGILLDQRKHTLAYNSNLRLNSVFTNSLMWEIFSIIGVENFSDDPKWIANRLTRRKVPPAHIEHSLRRLQEIGAIERKDGKIFAKDIVAKHSIDLASVYLVALQRTIEHLNFNKEDSSAYFDSFCLILSDVEYDQIREILENAKRKIAAVSTKKGPKDRIAYYNSNLFFASK